MIHSRKKITIKDIAFVVGFAATIMWATASYWSIKANKERLKYLNNQKNE